MKEFIKSPFYSIIDNKLFYLGKYEINQLGLNKQVKKYILENEGVLLKKINIENKNDTVLVLEPHPDDFVLSALGYTLNRYNALVANVFSKMNIKSFTWLKNIEITDKEYERLRTEESRFAIEKLLNQRFISLNATSTKINRKSKEQIKDKVLKFVKNIINDNQYIHTILLPMGIGWHPDHLIVHNAIMDNYKMINNIKVILYPEYPYARTRKFYNKRLEELNEKYKLKKIVIDVEKVIDILASAISVYRSQFDDINKNQMLAIIREDCRALAQENNIEKEVLIYYEVEDVKK